MIRQKTKHTFLVMQKKHHKHPTKLPKKKAPLKHQELLQSLPMLQLQPVQLPVPPKSPKSTPLLEVWDSWQLATGVLAHQPGEVPLQGPLNYTKYMGGSNLMQIYGSVLREFPYNSA